jgi:TonB-linked SusC/RagA family outer membrane protein
MTSWNAVHAGASRCFARYRATLKAIALVMSMAFLPGVASAQGAVAGVVIAADDQAPMAGATVTVVGTQTAATTDDQGRFRLGNVSGTSVVLEVKRLGYKVSRVNARVGDENLRIALAPNPTSLQAVVVTGTTGAAQRREIGNAVGMINASDVVAASPIMSVQSLLNGRTPSVVVMPTSGQVGTGSQVRIRGQSSLSLGNNPLLFVDGVRVNNAAATGPVSQAFGSSPISRLNDFNPEDIESIEVLKGPSAATLYGTEAANGVINIITKKGAVGVPRWNANIRQGVNYFADYQDRFEVNYGRRRLPTDPVTGTPTGPVEALNFDSLLVGACGDSVATRTGRKCDIYRTGRHQETELSVTGGAGLLNYYASGNLFDSQGAEPRSNRRHYSGRLNVSIAPSEKFRISSNIGHIAGPTHIPCDAGCGGYTWTTLSATPNNYNLANRHGFHSSLPYQYDQTVVLWQDLARTTASLRLEHEPLKWLNHRLVLGGDLTREGDNEYDPRVDSLQSLGFRSIVERQVTNRSLDYTANGRWDFRPSLSFQTSVGAQYFTESVHAVAASGSVFPTPGLKSVSSTTTRNPPTEGFSDDKTFGMYFQEQVSWRDRLYVTGALRMDDHSAFGSSFNRVKYPKLSVSYVVSEESWFRIPMVSDRLDEFRLRMAYGESGKAPTTYSAIRTYSTTAGPGDAPAVTPNTVGNDQLGPEKSKEIELGFDASAWQDRLGLEFTYYNKKTADAILDAIPAPSSGQANARPINVAGIINSGLELNVRATPWRSDRVNFDISAQMSTNDSEIQELGIPGQYFVDIGGFLRHQVGYPAFGWYDQRVVSTPYSRTTGFPAPAVGQQYPTGVMCSDTLPNSNGKEGGPARPCVGNDGIWGTSDDAPNVFLGRSIPPTEYAFSGTLTLFQRWRVLSMFDVKNGHKKMDGNTRVRCGIFGRCKENFVNAAAAPTSITPFTAEFADDVDSLRAAQSLSNSNLVDFLITNASFGRWRELTVSYDVPDRFARMAKATRATVSLSGRNLALWTSYQGFEPEAMFLGGTRGGNAAWEQTTLPQLRSWMLTFNLGF